MNQNEYYWKDKREEDKTIRESAFVTAIWELVNLAQEDLSKKRATWKDIFGVKKIFKKKKKQKQNKIKVKGYTRELIDENLKISKVAKHYKIKVKNGLAICPFHEDTNPSLSLSDDKNVFYCFGCNAKGDIIEFVRRLEIKNGQKRSSKKNFRNWRN